MALKKPYIIDQIDTIKSDLADIVTLAPSGTDDTTAIQTVLDQGKVPRLIQGTYIVDHLNLDDNSKIITSGYRTKLKQKVGVVAGTRILSVIGSNVVVDEMTYEGNIATDTGEQNHAVIVFSASKTISNVWIKGIKATDIRGDGLYIGGNTSYNPQNIVIGNIYSQNCIRNGVSITGGKNIKIDNIIALQCGVIGVDFESDTQGGAIKNVIVGNIITSNMGVFAAGTGYPYVESVKIGNITLRRSYMNSTPDYPNALNTDNDGITFRNAKNIEIESIDIDGFDRHAVFFNISGGDRYSDNVTIKNLTVANCSLTDVTYNSYINVAGCNVVKINNINSTVQTGAGKELIKGTSKTANEQNVIIENATHTGGRFAYLCGLYAKNIKATSDVGVFGSLKQLSKIQNSTLTGATYLVTYSDNVIFEGDTITYTSGKESNGINIYRNNIVNTVYTA